MGGDEGGREREVNQVREVMEGREERRGEERGGEKGKGRILRKEK